MMQMLLRADLSEKLARVHRSVGAPTVQQRSEFMAARAARPKYAASVKDARSVASSDPENYAVVGNVAQICVDGVLSEEPDFWAWLMGCDGSTYKDIRDSFALAASDPLVKSVVLAVSSPGGYTDGLFETLGAIESFGKPITVQASLACSAAYALAAMAGPITALGPASEFGSIGVLQVHRFYADEEIVNVTSTAAPNKRPDVRTAEGKAVIVAELDAVHELFADAIARGRSNATGKKYTVEQVNTDFGRGATMLAEDAYAAGLIDKKPRATKRGGSSAEALGEDKPELAAPIEAAATPPAQLQPPPAPAAGAPNPQSPPRTAGQETRKVTQMTEEELLAQFPAVHSALIAKGVAQGQAAERKRACAHLKLAKATGAREVAEAAIASGASTMDEDVHADYMAAAIGKRETSARQADSDEAGKALEGAAPVVAEGGKDLGDEVADRIEALMGKAKKAS